MNNGGQRRDHPAGVATAAAYPGDSLGSGRGRGTAGPLPLEQAWGRRARSSATGLVVALVVALVAAACGGTQAPGPSRARPDATHDLPGGPDAGGSGSILPAMQVLDVASGRSVDLGGLVPADRPTLLWFWAPH